jgi:hypothetical protein
MDHTVFLLGRTYLSAHGRADTQVRPCGLGLFNRKARLFNR